LLFWVSGGGGFYRSRVTSGIRFFAPGMERRGGGFAALVDGVAQCGGKQF